MSEISINTTQNVNIHFTAANIGQRIGASIIDLIIKIAYLYFINITLISSMNLDAISLDNWSEGSIYLICYSPAIFYTLLCESFMEGQTIGKKLLSLRVVKIDGYQASFLDYLIRWVFRLIDNSGTSYIAGITSMAVSKIHQRLGDMAAGTAVINIKSNIDISHTILENIAPDYKPTFPQVIRFSDNDMRIIKDTYLLARKSQDRETLSKLVAKIEEVAEIKCTEREEVFISKVIRDYNFYTGE